MDSLFRPSTLLWLAAFFALVFLVFSGVIAEITTNRRRDMGMRVMRMLVYLMIPVLAVFPALVVVLREASDDPGLGLLFYVVFFALFCYYFGKRVGVTEGRTHMSELIGLDSPDNIEDAQDRLFESRLRFPARSAVVKSIAEMAKTQEEELLERERESVGRKDGVANVPVEPVRDPARANRKKTRQ